MNDRLIDQVEEIVCQKNIQIMAWLSLSAFGQIHRIWSKSRAETFLRAL